MSCGGSHQLQATALLLPPVTVARRGGLWFTLYLPPCSSLFKLKWHLLQAAVSGFAAEPTSLRTAPVRVGLST